MNYSNKPILITGIERSGSTIVAKIIESCGVFTGCTTRMHENHSIKTLVSRLYGDNNLDPRGQFPIPEQPYINLYTHNWKSTIKKILDREGYKGDNLWLYKSSRIGQTWPVWNNLYPEAKWIVVRRRTGDIVQSCIKTGFMSAFKDKSNLQKINAVNEADGWLWWVHEQENRFVEMVDAGLNCKVIWPERMRDGDFEQMYEILNWLGLEWPENFEEQVKKLF